MLEVVAVAVTWITSVTLGVLWLRLRADPQRVAARHNLAGWFWVLAPCATALTLGLGPVGSAIDRVSGYPQVAHLIKHLLGLGPLRLLLLRAEALARPARATRSPTLIDRLTWHWWVVGLVLTGCYIVSPDRESLMQADNGLGGVSGVVYWVAFLGYFSVPCISFAASTLRYRRLEREPTNIRAAQTLLAISGISFVAYMISKLMFVSASASALIQAHGRTVTNAFICLGFVFLCLGAGRSRVSPPRWMQPMLGQFADWTRTGLLSPLWRELRQATPSIHARLLTPAPTMRLERREREVSEGLSKITDWINPDDRTQVEKAITARRDDETLITAVLLELARRRKLAGEHPHKGSAADEHNTPRLDDGPSLQRLATAWPEAVEVCDALEYEHRNRSGVPSPVTTAGNTSR